MTSNSNTNQLIICLRWVDDIIQTNEEFDELHLLKCSTADDIKKGRFTWS